MAIEGRVKSRKTNAGTIPSANTAAVARRFGRANDIAISSKQIRCADAT